MKTKAAILFKLNSPLVIEEVEIPTLRRGQALVKMIYSGVCRKQINEINGWNGPDKFLPHMMGHEGSAEVVDVGDGVKKVKKGDYVVASWIKGEGMEGGPSQYQLGGQGVVNAGSITTFSEYAVISENRLTKVSREIPAEVAAIFGCAVATGSGIVLHTLDVKEDSSIAIFGVGGVGASAILGAKMRNCKPIIAVDINSRKLGFAQKLGATDTINCNQENAVDKIKEKTKGGVDYAVEASGVKSAMEMAFGAINNRGTLVIAGNLKAKETINIDPFGLICGKKLLGTWGGETVPDRDIPFFARLYLQGKFNLDLLISKTFKLEEINKALKLLDTNESLGRVVIDLTRK